MESDLRRLNEMIGRLLTVAKLEATPTLQTPLQVDLNALLKSVVADAAFEAQEKGIHFEVVQSADVSVQGDPTLLRSAIDNVLRNAVRYTRTETIVEVLLGVDQAINSNEAVLVIRDLPTSLDRSIASPIHVAKKREELGWDWQSRKESYVCTAVAFAL
jgi:two-component system sensor histidine kinase CpxA